MKYFIIFVAIFFQFESLYAFRSNDLSDREKCICNTTWELVQSPHTTDSDYYKQTGYFPPAFFMDCFKMGTNHLHLEWYTNTKCDDTRYINGTAYCFTNLTGHVVVDNYVCAACTEPSDPVPDPPQDTNTTQWELLAEKSCKDNTALPQECSDNNTSDILVQTWKTGCCGTNTKCWKSTPVCHEPDTTFPHQASNEEVIDIWSEPKDRSAQCSENKGTVQEKRVSCKKQYRCVKTTDSCPLEKNEPISSYVSPRDGVFHEDIEVTGADFGLHYSSANVDDMNIAHGWSLSNYARLDGDRLYYGSGQIYTLTIVFGENNHTLMPSGNMEYVFDDNGTLLQTRDLYTKETKNTFGYDNMGRLVTITDIYGEISTLERDANGTVTAIVAPTGQRTLLHIDSNGDLLEVQYEDTSSYAFSYERHLMTKETEPNGNAFLHFFDANGKVFKVIDAEQAEWEFASAIGTDFGSHTVTKASGDMIYYKNHFVQNGVLKSEKRLPTGDIITYENAIDDTNSTVTSCGMRTTRIYKKNADGTLYKDPYTNRRMLESSTVRTPGGLQKVTTVEKRYRADDNGTLKNIYTATTTNAKRYKAKRDYLRHRAWQISPLGKKITTRYDSRNVNLLSIKPYAQYKTTYTYDDKGRVTKAKTGFRTTTYSYDDRGNMQSLTDPLGRTTHYGYDSRDRLTEVTYPDGTSLHYAYDSNGNMTLLQTPIPTDHTFGYNGVNKRTAYTTPLQKVTTYSYDKQRRLVKLTKPSGKSIETTYTNGRVSKVTTPEDTIDYTYACQSYPSAITKGSESIAYSYDGTLITGIALSGTLSQSIAYSYNNDFLPLSITYAGSQTAYSYNKDNELIQSGSYTITRTKRFGLDVNITDGIYTQTSHYNLYGELGRRSDALFGVKLYRNKAGQITKKIETLQGKKTTYTYRYDARGRLTTVRKNRKVVEYYTYDANGNRLTATSKERNITNQLQSYNTDDEITLIGQLEQSYDEDGYLTAKTLPDGSRYTYSYNTLGALTDATLPDGTQIHYITDPLNRRIAKEVNGTITEKYLWEDLTTLLAVYDSNNNLIQRFEYADGRMPISMTDASGKRYYLHYDQVGSLRAISRVLSPDNTIKLVKEITYDTYGNIINDSNRSLTVPFGFAGGLYDPDTKLTHFGFREYDAYTGKWTSKDPIGFAGGDSNLYGYVLGDPVSFFDPDGLINRSGGHGHNRNYHPFPSDQLPYDPTYISCSQYPSTTIEGKALHSICKSFPSTPYFNCTRKCLAKKVGCNGDDPDFSYYYSDHPVCFWECHLIPLYGQ